MHGGNQGDRGWREKQRGRDGWRGVERVKVPLRRKGGVGGVGGIACVGFVGVLV